MRAAVVGGGAYVAGRSMGRRAEQQQQAEGDQDQRISDLEQQQQQQTAPAPREQAPAAAATSPMIDQLNQLATLHQQGILSDDEFTAAKAKLFGT
jgi:hypothetical protein